MRNLLNLERGGIITKVISKEEGKSIFDVNIERGLESNIISISDDGKKVR